LFSMSRPQHVQADPHVRVKKSLAIKRALSRALDSDKDYSFHRVL
jgi:hypothetical protein